MLEKHIISAIYNSRINEKPLIEFSNKDIKVSTNSGIIKGKGLIKIYKDIIIIAQYNEQFNIGNKKMISQRFTYYCMFDDKLNYKVNNNIFKLLIKNKKNDFYMSELDVPFKDRKPSREANSTKEIEITLNSRQEINETLECIKNSIKEVKDLIKKMEIGYNDKRKQLIQNSNVIIYIENFIKYNSYNCLMTPESLYYFEQFVYRSNTSSTKKSKDFFNKFDKYYRNITINYYFNKITPRFIYIEPIKRYKRYQEYKNYEDCEQGYITESINKTKCNYAKFYNEDIIKLANLFVYKYNFKDESEALLVLYDLITLKMVEIYSDEWYSSYLHIFKDNLRNYDQDIENYCYINDIDIKKDINIGKFTYYLILKYKKQLKDFPYIFNDIAHKVNEYFKKKSVFDYEKELLNLSVENLNPKLTIYDVDLMNGYEFECFVTKLFINMGYAARKTSYSKDQGIDVLCEKNNIKLGVQAKCYSKKVSNSAIQEVVAGLKYHNCNKGLVVTNNYFTGPAEELASVNNIILWDRDVLIEKIDELF